MTSSSVSVMVAKSSNTSVPTAVVRTVWCGAPAINQASAEVDQDGEGSHTAHATGGCGGEPQPDGIVAIADRQRVDLQGGGRRGDAGTHLEHVRTEDALAA